MNKLAALCVLVAVTTAACASQTTFHTVPLGVKVHINGALCGESPCVYHSRYGFPDRMHVQLDKEGYQPADFYLDTEAPLISYLLLGFGSYIFHTFAQEYRFQLKPQPATATSPLAAPTPTAPAPPSPPAAPENAPTGPVPSPDAPTPTSPPPAAKSEPISI